MQKESRLGKRQLPGHNAEQGLYSDMQILPCIQILISSEQGIEAIPKVNVCVPRAENHEKPTGNKFVRRIHYRELAIR